MNQSWPSRIAKSIERERREVEKRYGIRIGQTEIYCARCGRPWGFGGHTCMDLRLEQLREKKRGEISEIEGAKSEAYAILRDFGPKKVSIYLMMPERTVTNWIQRQKVPQRHVEKILNLQKRAGS